jgi:hypothetical protein
MVSGEIAMLSEDISLLLTAFIDGEATARQRREVESLLQRSADARTLFQQLHDDAQKIRRLPRRALDPEFSEKILRTISDRRLPVCRRLSLTHKPPIPAWVGLAVAASVLFVAAVGSYFYFDAAQKWQDNVAAKKNDSLSPVQPKRPPVPESLLVKSPESPEEKEPDPQKAASPPTKIAKDDTPPAKAPPTPDDKPPANSELAAPNPKIEGFEVVQPGVALTMALRDLDREYLKLRLRSELQRENAYRLELFSLGKGSAINRLQAAFKTVGVRLLIDQEAQARLKNRHFRTDYVLYMEGLTGSDLAKILEKLGKDDKTAEAKKRGDGQFDELVLVPLTKDDRKELSTLLGVDPLQLQAPKAKGPLGVDIRKPIAEGTAAQVTQNLEGKGTPRPEAGKPAASKLAEHLAIVLPYNPVRAKPASSKEIKQFLESRKEKLPGTIQLLLVLRNVNG